MNDSLKIGIGLFKKESVKSTVSSIRGEFSSLKKEVEAGFTQMATGGLMVAGAAYAAFSLLDRIAEQDEALQDLKETTRTADSGFKSLKKSVYDLNTELGLKSVTESAGLLNRVARQSKKSGEELDRLAFQTGLLGKKFGDEEGALSAQISLMKNFGASVKESGDSVAYLLNQGGDLKGELLESLNEYGVQFKEAGFNLKETVSMLGAGLENAWNIDKTADAIKEARLRLFGGDKSAVDAFKILGLDGLSEKIQKEEVSIGQAFSQISAKMKGLNKSDMLKAGAGIFGTQWEDAGSESVIAMLGAMSAEAKTTGELDNMAAIMQQRFSFKWQSALSETTNSISELLDSLKPHILPIVEWFGDAAKTVREFSQEYGYITKSIAAGIGGFITLTAGLGTLKIALGAGKIALAALTSPLGLAVGIIAGVAWGLYELEQRTGWVSLAWDGLKETFGHVVDFLGPSIDTLKKDFFSLVDEWSKLWDELTDGFEGFGGISIDFKLTGELIGSMIDLYLITPIKTVTRLIGKLPKVILSIKKMWDEGFSIKSIKEFGAAIKDFLLTPFRTVKETLDGLPDWLKPAWLKKDSPKKVSAAEIDNAVSSDLRSKEIAGKTTGQAGEQKQTVFQIDKLVTRERNTKKTLRNLGLQAG